MPVVNFKDGELHFVCASDAEDDETSSEELYSASSGGSRSTTPSPEFVLSVDVRLYAGLFTVEMQSIRDSRQFHPRSDGTRSVENSVYLEEAELEGMLESLHKLAGAIRDCREEIVCLGENIELAAGEYEINGEKQHALRITETFDDGKDDPRLVNGIIILTETELDKFETMLPDIIEVFKAGRESLSDTAPQSMREMLKLPFIIPSSASEQ